MRNQTTVRRGLVAAALAALLGCQGQGGAQEGAAAADVAPQSISAYSGSMIYTRGDLTLTRLSDGKVLAAGGYGSTGVNLPAALATAELYDPATGTWSLTGSMGHARTSHTATLLPSGKVLVVGGSDGTSAQASAELYDPASGQWSPAPDMSAARSLHTATTLDDGRVLVVGGQNTTASSRLSSCAIYDPVAGTWSSTGGLSYARANHAAARIAGGKVVVVFGWGSSGSLASGAEVYDPATGAWTYQPTYLGARQYMTAFSLPSGKALFAGGESSTGGKSGDALLFDPATGAFTSTGTFSPRSGAAGVVLPDGRALMLGGGQTDTSVDVYDPATSTWSNLSALLAGRERPRAVVLLDGRVLVAGGTLHGTELYSTTCTPLTCEAAGAACGTRSDGCGGTLSCGSCADGQVCTANTCCTPLTCQGAGAACGARSDGCGGTLSCGTCTTGQLCIANACCTPLTCADIGATCGTPSNGCGWTLSCGSCGGGQTCQSNTCVAIPGQAGYDPTYKAPRCTAVDSSCDSGTLLVGRGSRGPESNAPNTLGGTCADGTGGSFHLDESLDKLRITSLDGGPLTAGKGVRIQATVWAYSSFSSDKLDLYSAANAASPSWTYLGTLTPAAGGAQTLSLDFTLPAGTPVQAIRGTFRYGGAAGACTTGSYDDHDDLVFAVSLPQDVTPPTVALTAPQGGATLAGTVSVTATASDDVGVTRVDFLDGAQLLGSVSAAPYALAWNTRAAANGAHTLSAVAWDGSGKSTSSDPVTVTVANDVTPPAVSLTAPAPGAVLSGSVQLLASATDDVGVARVEFYDGAALLGTSAAPPYGVAWNTAAAVNGGHTLTARAYDAAGNAAISAGVTVTVSNVSLSVLNASYDAVRRAPVCTAVGAGCDTGTLVNGRGMLGPEPNAPNTIGASCADGASGSYHSDESLDRLRVSTVDGGAMAASKVVRVDATVWAWSTSDHLDVYYAASASSPTWILVGTLTPAASGAQTLSITYTLPAGALQAVRGNFRYLGSPGSCTTGSYDDRDDVIFAVQ
jgi:hypothetical protein